MEDKLNHLKTEQKDFFAQKAKNYDDKKSRTENVDNIAQTIIQENSLSNDMHILDFGSGTGLLTSQIAPFVNEITAVDVSKSMTEVLKSKKEQIACKLNIVELDLTKEKLAKKFDGIISSMTIHHIKDVTSLFTIFYELLDQNGFIAIADLDKEDGNFHSEDTGIHHFGFDRNQFMDIANNAGFKNLKIQTANVIHKESGNYPVFLLTGIK